MKVFKPGEEKLKGRTEAVAVLDEKPCGEEQTNSANHYEIRWQEIYEFSTEVKADTYEEALRKANAILRESAMLTDLTEWRCGDDEDTAHSTMESCEVEASFDSQGIVECLPAIDEDSGEDTPDAKKPTCSFVF